MHDSSLSFLKSFLSDHRISFIARGESGHRQRGVEVNAGAACYCLIFEERELPSLSVTYRGVDQQFVTEEFTVQSFPDISTEFQVVMSRSGKKQYEEVFEQYGLRLTQALCEVLERRIKIQKE